VTNAQQEHALSPSQTDTAAVELRSDPDPQPGGNGLAHSGIEDPRLVHIPDRTGAFAEDPGDSGGVLMVENGASPPLADPDGAASTFAAKTADADADAPAPCTPAEAKRSHNWPPWEEPTESPVTHKVRAATQTPSQTGSINIDDPNHSDHGGHAVHPLQLACINATSPCYQPADHKLSLSPTDHQDPLPSNHTPASAAKSCITRDMPHRKAVNTCTWAALPTRPATTFADANGSIAIHWRATSGHAFPIDGGTTPPFSKQQEAAPPPTIGSGHIAATEASHPHSPISGTFTDPNAPTHTSSNNHAAVAFKRDHPPHPPDLLGHQEVELPGSCAADDMVADMPTPLLSTKEKHFVASPGPCAK